MNKIKIPTRIVTRPDFDGIACAVLLRAVFKSPLPILWVEPNDMDRGKIEILEGDIIANLPYNSSCLLWFDHHKTNNIESEFSGSFKVAPSAASVIMEYYSDELSQFSELVYYTDKIDSANLTKDEILSPEKYPYLILSMTLSGESQDDFEYFNWLVEKLAQSDIDEIIKVRMAFTKEPKGYEKTILSDHRQAGGLMLKSA